MTSKVTDKKSRLVKAASELSHAHGFGKIALADIAEAAQIPLGNVYYYFRTKTAIGEAIIAQRCDEFRQLKDRWDQLPTPKGRLKAFVQMTVDNRKDLARSGCPVGSLCSELSKEESRLGKEVAQPFRQLLIWLETQFAALGRKSDKAALAIHLLSSLQGVSLLAHCFHDATLIPKEARQLNAWIDSL